jgi:hypothetical protein
MTLRRYLLILLALLILWNGVTAISPITDKRPANIPANATVNISEDIQEKPVIPVHATQLEIERIHSANAAPGTELAIALKISNHGVEHVNAQVYEDLRLGLEYLDTNELGYHIYEGLKIPYYTWKISLDPASTKTLTYRVIPKDVGLITFPSAIVIDEFSNHVESNTTLLTITCKPNGTCDPGENTIFCPQDCPSGSADDLCDGIQDNRIDPDCQSGFDPDAPIPTQTTPLNSFIGAAAVLGAFAMLFRKKK